jgi:hypothetical protein
MQWTVAYNRKAVKQRSRLPMRIQAILDALTLDIRRSGPVRGDWPNYSRLGDGVHHCHLKKGHPTYVAVWQEKDGEIRLVEFIYVGTHEKAPY